MSTPVTAIPDRVLWREADIEAKFRKQFLIHKRRNIYIACEEMNLLWDEDHVTEITKLWNAGTPVTMIAEKFKRSCSEIAVLLIDLAERGVILQRPGGVFGGGYE